eukprot:5485372-Amphidinium_carterae.1
MASRTICKQASPNHSLCGALLRSHCKSSASSSNMVALADVEHTHGICGCISWAQKRTLVELTEHQIAQQASLARQALWLWTSWM